MHNLAFQGVFPMAVRARARAAARVLRHARLEFYGQVSFMKGGLGLSDRLTTVSPTYAREIQGEEQGCGLDGVLRERAGDLSGILNGVDPQVWSPATDAGIAAPTRATRGRQGACRRALQAEFGARAAAEAPLFGIVSRLTDQKGFTWCWPASTSCSAAARSWSCSAAATRRSRPSCATPRPRIRRRSACASATTRRWPHRIVAGADVILVPSRFEPCGLTQLYGLRYGTLPLVRRVGGLADTVVDSTLENLGDDHATASCSSASTSATTRAPSARLRAVQRRPRMAHRAGPGDGPGFDWEQRPPYGPTRSSTRAPSGAPQTSNLDHVRRRFDAALAPRARAAARVPPAIAGARRGSRCARVADGTLGDDAGRGPRGTGRQHTPRPLPVDGVPDRALALQRAWPRSASAPLVEEALAAEGLSLSAALEEERDAALGNGGLGRLRPAFLDSFAELGLRRSATGCATASACSHSAYRTVSRSSCPTTGCRTAIRGKCPRPEAQYRVGFGGEVHAEGTGRRWLPAESSSRARST
jgi:hypothetical protein